MWESGDEGYGQSPYLLVPRSMSYVTQSGPSRRPEANGSWRCLCPPSSSDGHTGSADRTTIALAERMCGEAYRIDRRDCLDHVVVFGEQHLRHLLNSYQKYCNEARTHLSLHKDAPIARAVQTVGHTLAVPILGGLHHQYFTSVSFRQGQVGAL